MPLAPARILLLLLLPTLPAVTAYAAAAHSELWGEHGERWSATERLPDYSHAGYHRGELPLPDRPVATNVRDFGAVGDGIADDTRAIQAAIDATRDGAVLVPPGRYLVSDYLRIGKSGIVLRGAGPERSVLWFPRGLDEIHPRQGRTSTGSPASGYSFDGGFVTLRGDYQARVLTKIVGSARRGDREVEVERSSGLRVGQWVLVRLQEAPDQSLKTHLYCGDPGDIRRGKRLDTKMLLQVVALEPKRVRFNRPLRFETRPAWQPEICAFQPTVTESGIEELGFEFPPARYRGHFKENGANAIELRQVHHCWVRNVTIRNGDLGINVVACGNTITGVTLIADQPRGTADGGVPDCTGHHGIQCKGAEDNLITRFEVRAPYIHDLSVEHASGNVFVAGSGRDLNFDHHKDTPYENLFTDIDCGRGTRVWRCGGGASIGRQSAGWETFWNIRADRPIAPPSDGWGPGSMNFVGLATTTRRARTPGGIWWEVLPPASLVPANLHAAQLARRLAASGQPP